MNTRSLPMQFSQPGDRFSAFAKPSARFARFGSFDLDFRREELFRAGARVPLPRKVLDVLLILIEKPGDIVTRESLRARLWPPDQNVNFDANVNTTVNKLRQILGDCTNKPTFVETIPRRGYVFIARTEFSDQPAVPIVRSHSAVDAETHSHSVSAPVASLSPRSHHFSWVSLKVLGYLVVGIVVGALASYLALHR